MTLSVCMIVKNEEKVLSRCLDCVKFFADELVIVDTGSSDKTREIARKYTEKVYDFEWCDDFSLARNFAFSKASCDYIMWLDADDVVGVESINKIISLKSKMTADVYMAMYHVGFDERGVPNFSYYRERIVRRGGNFKWVGFVHEVIELRGQIVYADFCIEHRKENRTHANRNLRIYRKKLKEGHVFSPRENYYYGRELYYNGYYKKAEKVLLSYLKTANYSPDIQGACCIVSECRKTKKEYEKGVEILYFALKNTNPTSEICCRIGELYSLLGKLKQAEFWYKSALCVEQDKLDGGFYQSEYAGLVPSIELSVILYRMGKINEAREFHLLAKLINPQNPIVIHNEKFF